MARHFTKYPQGYVSASKKSNPKYETVGDLKKALASFPDDYPIKVIGDQGWGIDKDSNLCFIKTIADYDDACEIEII